MELIQEKENFLIDKFYLERSYGNLKIVILDIQQHKIKMWNNNMAQNNIIQRHNILVT